MLPSHLTVCTCKRAVSLNVAGTCFGFYRDGAFFPGARGTGGISYGTVDVLTIGARSDNSLSTRFNGAIDNLRIFNRVLSGSELRNLSCTANAPQDIAYLRSLGMIYNFDFESPGKSHFAFSANLIDQFQLFLVALALLDRFT